jgi:hypothetical protein
MNQLGELAYNIWDIEFGDHSTALQREREAMLISGYLEVNLGQMNVLINTDFELNKANDEVVPSLNYEEKAILTQLYLKDYMNKQARNVLRNATTTSSTTTTSQGVTDWIELREGDSAIKRSIATSTSKNASAKLFQDSAKESAELLKRLIHSYNMYGAKPLQVMSGDSGDCGSGKQDEGVGYILQTVRDYIDGQSALTEANILQTVTKSISANLIAGYAHTFALKKGDGSIFIDWSSEFLPSQTPTVLATLRSRNEDDPIIAYRIQGAVSLSGVNIVFSSDMPNSNYAIEVAAFLIGPQ